MGRRTRRPTAVLRAVPRHAHHVDRRLRVRFILRRIGFYLIAFWVSITLNFLLPRFMPGDPISRMLSRSQDKMTAEQVLQLQKLFGMDDRPIHLQ